MNQGADLTSPRVDDRMRGSRYALVRHEVFQDGGDLCSWLGKYL
jgi:hypothetical protein